ncbi:MAG: HlyC/CorC family transporter [Ignavibacteria bacterium]|nr:MAG: HlyC/CorC family transporter [Ignavibacteria bacterium]
METDWFFKIILLIISLEFSALFSGAEVSLFSLDKKHLSKTKDSSTSIKYIARLLDSPRRLLVTILIGNTIFNVLTSIVSVTLALDIAHKYGYEVDFILLLQIVLITILVLIFGEITPKVIASRSPLGFSKIISIPLYWISVLLYPAAKILTETIKVSTSKFKYDKSKSALDTSELKDLADLGVESGTLEEEEHELIHGLVTFKKITAREVMTPRVDVVALPENSTFEEALKTITESGHSRIPIYEENLDNILGILYAKDLLPYLGKVQASNLNLRKICRKAYFIPETKLINELMHEFQDKNIHVGIVVDEYGGTSGLISLEDIIEEIVGEIRDEYDKEENEITQLDDNRYLVLGKTDVAQFNEILKAKLDAENEDFDTIGGFIFNQAGEIPDVDYSFVEGGFKFTVKEISNKRINKVLVERVEEDD